MENLPDRSKWSKIDRALEKSRRENLPLHPDRPLDVPGQLHGPDAENVAKPDGVIASFKANKIERRAALEHLEVWYKTSLDVAKHRLGEVARVRKAEATVIAEQFLQNLDQLHLQYLMDLGLRNEAARQKALLDRSSKRSKTGRPFPSTTKAAWPSWISTRTRSRRSIRSSTRSRKARKPSAVRSCGPSGRSSRPSSAPRSD